MIEELKAAVRAACVDGSTMPSDLKLREAVATEKPARSMRHSGPCFRDWCCDACYWKRLATVRAEKQESRDD